MVLKVLLPLLTKEYYAKFAHVARCPQEINRSELITEVFFNLLSSYSLMQN